VHNFHSEFGAEPLDVTK